ncbi:hypothetical protein [Nannocystis pusilla]|uniref:hypothetical protein n=1 Tax=Nannocystis pusilla TaxID=889268 RepID=UPI003B767099
MQLARLADADELLHAVGADAAPQALVLLDPAVAEAELRGRAQRRLRLGVAPPSGASQADRVSAEAAAQRNERAKKLRMCLCMVTFGAIADVFKGAPTPDRKGRAGIDVGMPTVVGASFVPGVRSVRLQEGLLGRDDS